jgi:ankyrin repeat protein
VPAGATPLDRAAAAQDFATVEALVAGGANPSVAAEDGTTPLMLLTGFSRQRFSAAPTADPARLSAIRALIAKGADVNAQQKNSGNSAMHFAAQRGVAEIVALLGEHGGDGALKNAAGKTPAELLVAGPPKAAPPPTSE